MSTEYGALTRVIAAGREYRAAVINAVDTLSTWNGPRTPYAQIAKAAGTTSRAVRKIVKQRP